MDIDISVIIPVFNGEKTIAFTIDSVLKQTYPNFEILIINDGSTDNTYQILKEYSLKDDRVKIINQQNSGVSKARNTGINNSNGDYICFLDADDFYHERFLEYMIKKIKESNNDICYCGVNFYPKRKKIKALYKFTTSNILVNYINGRLPVHTSTWMISRNFIKQETLYFREDSSWGEDLEFFYKALSNTRNITYVSKYLTYYRNNHSNFQLSKPSLDKVDMDYDFIMNIVNDKKINKNDSIEYALLNYRLPALITNKLLQAVYNKKNLDEVKSYYRKYEHIINKFEWSNGLMSLNLNFKKNKLKKILMKKSNHSTD